MGMTSDQNENLSFAEAKEIERREKEAAENKVKEPGYRALCQVIFNGKKYLLMAGEEDKKWYKAEFIKEIRKDHTNRSPLIPVYSEEITPVTEEEFYSYFPRPKEA